ncbi:MAG TPA: DUF4397 domain-containing protein [Gammaproteobacteria bacterium]|nr:DUF4397 domain-containing protein [Gammaproteobacteria bacterium]
MKLFPSALATVLLCTLLWGCSDDDDDSPTDTPDPNTPTAQLRAVHLSPDGPAVDISVNGAVALEDVTYRQASGFLSVPSGDTPVQVLVADTDTAVIDATLTLAEDQNYTVLAVNVVDAIEPLVIEDDGTAPASGSAALRVVHAAPNAPEVDVYVSGPADDFAGLSPLLQSVPFKAVADELEVPAGDYRVRVTLAGQSDIVYDSGTLTLADGVEYVAVASQVDGLTSPIGLTLLTDIADTPVALADDARARLRAVHASPDAPAVDISVDSAEVLSDVPFGVASDYLLLLGGTYNIDVSAADGSASVINADIPLAAGVDYTLAAVNFLSEISPLLLEDDNALPADGNVKLRLVHAAPSAPTVDVYLTAPDTDIADALPSIAAFNFAENTGYIEAPAGTYRVRVTVANTKTVAIDTGALTLEAGQIRTAFALDPSHSGGDFGVLLLEDRN